MPIILLYSYNANLAAQTVLARIMLVSNEVQYKQYNKKKNISIQILCSSFLQLHKAFLLGRVISDPLEQPLNSTDLVYRFPTKTNKPHEKHQNQPFQTSLICTQRLNLATAIYAYLVTTDSFKLANKMIILSPTIHENSNCYIFYKPTQQYLQKTTNLI